MHERYGKVSEMKKILCILVALACVLTVVSCNNSSSDGATVKNTVEEAVALSSPTKVVSLLTYKLPEGHLLYEYNDDLSGTYTLVTDGENSIFDYSYGTPAGVDEDNGSPIKKVEGVIYYKDGKVSTDGDAWTASSAESVTTKFNLSRGYFKTYTKSEDGLVLTATATGDNMEYVIGHKIPAASDVSVIVTTNGVYLTMVEIRYTTSNGAEVYIQTSYSYNNVELEFPVE